ncbi:hypothetical protein ES702_05975 [subsurface metagenome]
MAGIGLKLPTLNQVIALGTTMLALMFCLRFMPENFKQFFRV